MTIPESVREEIRKEAEEKHKPDHDPNGYDVKTAERQAHIEAAEAMWIKCNRWIPVSERMPEEDQWVLAYAECSVDIKITVARIPGYTHVRSLKRDVPIWQAKALNVGTSSWHYSVFTHWKPLPPSPHE